jgi:hypothetical protein
MSSTRKNTMLPLNWDFTRAGRDCISVQALSMSFNFFTVKNNTYENADLVFIINPDTYDHF